MLNRKKLCHANGLLSVQNHRHTTPATPAFNDGVLLNHTFFTLIKTRAILMKAGMLSPLS